MSPERGSSPEEAVDPDEILAEFDLAAFGDTELDAHGTGELITFRQAIVDCPPLVGALRATAGALEGLPDRAERLQKWVVDQAAESPSSDAAKKK